MRRLLILLGLVSMTAITLGLFLPGVALAHESRLVANKYQFEVGFLNEPTVVGQMNGVNLIVTIPSQNSKPVDGLQNTLRAEVIVGGRAKVMALQLEALEGQPGSYAGYFIPTMSGSYMFHFTGTVEGTAIDETFESGPGRFADVQPADALQFPFKYPDPVTQSDFVQTAVDQSSGADTIAWLGFAFGFFGLVLGTISLVRPRRRKDATESKRDRRIEM